MFGEGPRAWMLCVACVKTANGIKVSRFLELFRHTMFGTMKKKRNEREGKKQIMRGGMAGRR